MPTPTPDLAKRRARLAGPAAARHDPRLATAPARAAFLARFEREVDAGDPDRLLDPVERARRVEYLQRLYFARLAYRSHAARAERRAAQLWAESPGSLPPIVVPRKRTAMRKSSQRRAVKLASLTESQQRLVIALIEAARAALHRLAAEGDPRLRASATTDALTASQARDGDTGRV
jgi:hypothetical protein